MLLSKSFKLFRCMCRSSSRVGYATAVNASQNISGDVIMPVLRVKKPEVEEELCLYEPWSVHRLDDKEHINQAKALMYRVFVQEIGWKHAENTPTGFAIGTLANGDKILKDKLDSQSVWYGVVHEERVIASMRRVNRDNFGHLDMTRYPSSQKPSLASILSPIMNPRLTELQRTVIDKRFRGTTVLPWLFYYAFNDIYENNLNVIGSAASRKLRTVLAKYFNIRLVDNEFYYSENMDGPSSVFYLEKEEIPGVLKVITNMIKYGKRC